MDFQPVQLPWPYPKLDYHKQSIEVPGTKKPGQTGECRVLLAEYHGLIRGVYRPLPQWYAISWLDRPQEAQLCS